MSKTCLFCLILIMFVSVGVGVAQEEKAESGEPILYIDKNTESGRGAFEMNNHFHNYCVAKYKDSSQVYRCRNMCIEKAYPVFNETDSVKEAIMASGCFETK